jgi:hypothetical protein
MDDIITPSLAHRAMAEDWQTARALLGGTKTLRAGGETFLPRYPAEPIPDYRVRLKRAVLTNYYAQTIRHLVGKAFSRPLVLMDDVPPQIAEWCEDVDLQGTHINAFAAEVFREALGVGLVGILVDFPRLPPGASLAEERALGARPYMTMVPVETILGVRTDGPMGKIQMTRIVESRVEPDGSYGERLVSRIRVLTPGQFELYQGGADGAFALVDGGPMSIQRVPLVPVYGLKVGPWHGSPPLLDLAYKNIQHYQIDSDMSNALQVASFPILAASGYDQERDPSIRVGPNVVLATSDPSGRFYYVEHSGTAISAGRQKLEDLKAEMAMDGVQSLVPRAGGDVTATETQVKYAESTSDLQRMAFSLKDSLENALQLMAEWVGLPNGGSIELRGQFVLPRDAATEAQALISLRSAGEITSRTLLSELKRRDFLPDDFDIDAERELLDLEGPAHEIGQ